MEFVLPPGATSIRIREVSRRAAAGKLRLPPDAQKNRYAFNFPLRPGESQFQVCYRMPYRARRAFRPSRWQKYNTSW